MTIFEPFPKLARLSRECIVTEKIDGTNAQVIILDPENSENSVWEAAQNNEPLYISGEGWYVYAASRTRLIWPTKQQDNYGFGAWVKENAESLCELRPGRHFGEWYGKGIQRSYGLDHRRFALFNTSVWVDRRKHNTLDTLLTREHFAPACCDVVPVLSRGEFSTFGIDLQMRVLKDHGSFAVEGFMNPEGIVVYHTAANVAFKKTFDDRHKEAS